MTSKRCSFSLAASGNLVSDSAAMSILYLKSSFTTSAVHRHALLLRVQRRVLIFQLPRASIVLVFFFVDFTHKRRSPARQDRYGRAFFTPPFLGSSPDWGRQCTPEQGHLRRSSCYCRPRYTCDHQSWAAHVQRSRCQCYVALST